VHVAGGHQGEGAACGALRGLGIIGDRDTLPGIRRRGQLPGDSGEAIFRRGLRGNHPSLNLPTIDDDLRTMHGAQRIEVA
jgi:hypothetical protein